MEMWGEKQEKAEGPRDHLPLSCKGKILVWMAKDWDLPNLSPKLDESSKRERELSIQILQRCCINNI